jgi:hypothetical protein
VRGIPTDTSQAGFQPYSMPQLNGSYASGAGMGGVPHFTFPTNGVADAASNTPVANMNQFFRGPTGQMYGAGGAVGGSTNALAAGVGKGGAGVITGQAAQDYFAAMKQAALAQERQSGGDVWGHRYGA